MADKRDDALHQFAAKHGRNWRRTLRRAVANGTASKSLRGAFDRNEHVFMHKTSAASRPAKDPRRHGDLLCAVAVIFGPGAALSLPVDGSAHSLLVLASLEAAGFLEGGRKGRDGMRTFRFANLAGCYKRAEWLLEARAVPA